MAGPTWSEKFIGGSAEAEARIFEGYTREFLRIQLKQKRKAKAASVERASHAKMLLGVSNATLRVLSDVPQQFQVGFFRPGMEYPVTMRFSNASSAHQPDTARDVRGAALRIRVSDKESHDLFVANYPTAHVRNVRQFVAFARTLAGPRWLLIPGMILRLGPLQALRTARNLIASTRRQVSSLATESYWSRGSVLWGEGPVRYMLRPVAGAKAAPKPSRPGADYLREEMVARLRTGDVAFDVYLQPFVSEWKTPIENFGVTWREKVSQPVRVATLTIPKQDVDAAEGRARERAVDQLSFNPWYTTDEFRPLGNMNRARRVAYQASAGLRLGYRFFEEPPLRNVIASRFGVAVFSFVNRFVPWHRLPFKFALFNMGMFREVLRQKNLIDAQPVAPPKPYPVPPAVPEPARIYRTFDGTFNDLSAPRMGCCGSAFGRNMPPVYDATKLDQPDPIVVSRELLTRETFVPAKTLNVLSAAWIQFQVHDWVNHQRIDLRQEGNDNAIKLKRPGLPPWQNHKDWPAEQDMRIADNQAIAKWPGGCPVFANIATPWWDGSEVYGADADKAQQLRDGALIRLENGYLPTEISGVNVTGFNDSWWLGLSAMHTLFAREHNVICRELKAAYATWSDERVYQTARLIVGALIAKIHTVEWTPAITSFPPAAAAIRTNWYGAPKDWVTQAAAWLFSEHSLKGIPETMPDHHGVPFSLTEEFVSVYRLHPLIPDDYAFFDSRDGSLMSTHGFLEIQGHDTDGMMRKLELSNVLYSLGIANPGAVKLYNFPKSLQKLERLNGEIIDLSVVDIVRDRRRGVPRYNDFRTALRLPRARRWEDFSTHPETQRKLRQVYGKVDMVDTMVGMFAEELPPGFGFSDTAFRIFILMASRRIQSDRFLTVDFRPEIYSPLGMDWVANNSMTSIILRHCPELAGALPRGGNAFAPFRPIGNGR
jgi:hypothetical protein